MVFSFITFCIGLLSSYLLTTIFLKDAKTIHFYKVSSFLLAIYFSIVALVGLYLDFVGASLSSWNFFISFSLISIAGYYFIKQKEVRWIIIDEDAQKIIISVAVLLVAFGFLIYPSQPSFFPLASLEDAPRHFVLSDYIQNEKALPNGPFYDFENVMMFYPFGMHLNMALLSDALGIPLIQFVFPFSAFIIVLTALAIFGITLEIIGHFKTALLSGFLVITSSYLIYQLSVVGAWAMLFGGYISVIFVWILEDYRKKPNIPKSALITLLLSALILSYTYWAIVILTLFLFQGIDNLKNRRVTRGQIAYPVMASAIVTAHYWMDKLNVARTGLGETGLYLQNPLGSYGIVFVVLALLGIYWSERRGARLVLLFLLAVLLQPILLFLYSYATSTHVEAYWFYKMYYYLVYPLAIFAAIGLKDILERWDKNYRSRSEGDNARILLIFILISALGIIVVSQIRLAERNRGKTLGMTEEEYYVAKWMRDNLSQDEKITYFVNLRLSQTWFNAVSHYYGPYTSTSSSLDIAEKGEIFVVQNLGLVSENTLRGYDLLYKFRNVAVIRKL